MTYNIRPTPLQQPPQHNTNPTQLHPPPPRTTPGATVNSPPHHQPYRNLFQPILSPRYTVIPRPYIPIPRPHDAEETPLCTGCTAHLDKDDLNSTGLRDPDIPNTRYRLRMDQDQPPTHSNLLNDFIRIHRNNADYHRSQRDSEEQQQVTTGILPEYRASTSYTNTQPAANLRAAIDRLQYERYQQRGGRLPPGNHRLDSKYNSSNVTNMHPGDPYREWFHNTISRSHYSLGEATAHYNQWISDPDYGPNPRLNRHHNNDSPSYLPQVHHSPSPPNVAIRLI